MFSIICNEEDFLIIKIRDDLYALDGAGKRRVKLVDTIRADDYDPSELNDAINQVSDYDFVGEIEGFNKFGFWKTIPTFVLNFITSSDLYISSPSTST